MWGALVLGAVSYVVAYWTMRAVVPPRPLGRGFGRLSKPWNPLSLLIGHPVTITTTATAVPAAE